MPLYFPVQLNLVSGKIVGCVWAITGKVFRDPTFQFNRDSLTGFPTFNPWAVCLLPSCYRNILFGLANRLTNLCPDPLNPDEPCKERFMIVDPCPHNAWFPFLLPLTGLQASEVIPVVWRSTNPPMPIHLGILLYTYRVSWTTISTLVFHPIHSQDSPEHTTLRNVSAIVLLELTGGSAPAKAHRMLWAEQLIWFISWPQH